MKCLFVIPALACSVALAGPWHPDWGPEPPVAPYGMHPLPSGWMIVPMIFPIVGQSHYRNDYGNHRAGFLHTGIDIRASKMTPIVAPFSGTLGMKTMSFWIWSDKGWGMLGTHLNDDNLGRHDHRGDRDVMFAPNLYPGARVVAGQFIGYVGESGDATAPHLHFEIYAPGAGETMGRIRNPMPSLHYAQRISAPFSTLPSRCDRAEHGQVRYVGCIRRLDRRDSTMVLLLTDTERPNGVDHVATSIRYRTFKLSQEAIDNLRGWEVLDRVRPNQRVSVIAPDAGDLSVDPTNRVSIVDDF